MYAKHYPYMISIMDDVVKVGITKHAKQRLRIRGQLKLNQTQKDNLSSFIEIDFKRSKENRKVELVPFYRNKQWIKSNGRSYLSDSNMFTYVWKYNPDTKSALIITIYDKGQYNGN